jgi:hypothetical protein
MRLVIIGNESAEKILRNHASSGNALPTPMDRAFTATHIIYSPANLLIIIIMFFDYE